MLSRNSWVETLALPGSSQVVILIVVTLESYYWIPQQGSNPSWVFIHENCPRRWNHPLHKNRGHICLTFVFVCVIGKNPKTPNLSPMADDTIPHILEETGQTVMNRDEGMYDISHVYDPVLSTRKSVQLRFLEPGVTVKISALWHLDHNNISPEKSWLSSQKNCQQNSKFFTGFDI